MDLLRRILHEVMAEPPKDATPLPPPRTANLGADARALERGARAFLETLDPDSQEGLWFEAVAEGFPSRLEAAVAYVRDVKGARP